MIISDHSSTAKLSHDRDVTTTQCLETVGLCLPTALLHELLHLHADRDEVPSPIYLLEFDLIANCAQVALGDDADVVAEGLRLLHQVRGQQ
jgi:hypothetical protein